MFQECPFNGNKECNESCGLFIAPSDLIELMGTRLTSIGVFDVKEGMCSLKMLALSSGRYMFENTATVRRNA